MTPHDYTITLRGSESQPGDVNYDERFLLAQSPTGTVIFSSDENLMDLCQSEHCLCDGNFTYQPDQFRQLYTIHGFVRGECMPLVYALMVTKTRQDYDFVFRTIRSELLMRHPDLGNINGGFWHFDYEGAAINSFEAVFPEGSSQGCLFHFTSAVNKKLQNLGLFKPL